MELVCELTLKELEMVVGGFRHHCQRLAYRERILNHHGLKERENETYQIDCQRVRSYCGKH